MRLDEKNTKSLPLSLIIFIFLFAGLIAIIGQSTNSLTFNIIVYLFVLVTIVLILGYHYSNRSILKGRKLPSNASIRYYNNSNLISPKNISQEMKLCSYCNFKLHLNDSFCSNCGNKI